jgi:glucosyl-3-phosphoglycerate synthase
VEIAERYEHKHQELSAKDPGRGLHRMAREVTKHLLRTLAAAGVNLSEGLLRSLLAAYQREAEDAVADSYAVARQWKLRPPRGRVIHVFPGAVRTSIDEVRADPLAAARPTVRVWPA